MSWHQFLHWLQYYTQLEEKVKIEWIHPIKDSVDQYLHSWKVYPQLLNFIFYPSQHSMPPTAQFNLQWDCRTKTLNWDNFLLTICYLRYFFGEQKTVMLDWHSCKDELINHKMPIAASHSSIARCTHSDLLTCCTHNEEFSGMRL